jgi:hypothetical protein
VTSYLQEQYDEHTTQLTIQIDVAAAQAQYLRTTKPALPLAPPLAAGPRPDRTPYGLTLAAQVAARLDQGMALVPSQRGYGGMGLARAGAAYQYGEVWDGVLSPSKTLPSWAAFVAWLAVQSDFSLARSEKYALASRPPEAITRQRLTELVQRA